MPKRAQRELRRRPPLAAAAGRRAPGRSGAARCCPGSRRLPFPPLSCAASRDPGRKFRRARPGAGQGTPSRTPGASVARARGPPRPAESVAEIWGGAETEGLAAADTTLRRGCGPGAAGTCARSCRCAAPRWPWRGMGFSEPPLRRSGPIATRGRGSPVAAGACSGVGGFGARRLSPGTFAAAVRVRIGPG